ncbi:MAG: class I SAM-dependent DNA methyltransferase [Chloroflexota bacterium]|nr:class I SAM-dependent DNA methyltransferase [Chloroflexota bacterium]
MAAGNNNIEKRLWDAADELRVNSRLRASEYYFPVLGLIFLRYADYRFAQAEQAIKAERVAPSPHRRQRPVTEDDYRARGVLYLPQEARYDHLLGLPEGQNIGRAVIDAMKAIEAHNPDLKDVLPKTYNRLDDPTLVSLLRIFNTIEMDVEGDIFGKIYEYFLAQFAMSEGRRGGEFFPSTSIVRLIVEIIEPYHGRILDPACGSGGMFVQSAKFVQRHQGQSTDVSLYGQERVAQTVRLCKMNLAVHGLGGDIRQGNTYYEDIHRSPGRFDFVMANPPFNVNRVDKDRLKDDPRFPFGFPRVDNANYLWIQIFHSALNEAGRAGFVMANSAADARGSELEIRKKLIQSGAVDVMVSVASNFFYTVTLPRTLWFLDHAKAQLALSLRLRGEGLGVGDRDTVLFLDARRIYTQIDRAHREFTPAQIEFLANIVRLYRGREPETAQGSAELMAEHFLDGVYQDVPGLCKVATLNEIEAQGWSLNPGRYVGVAEREEEDFDFAERLMELHEELEVLNAEVHELEERIAENVAFLLET